MSENSTGSISDQSAGGRVLETIPTWLALPAAALKLPPVVTRQQSLPISALAWEDFERLCVRLARNEADVERCQLYGTRGQKQHGIDLFARLKEGTGYRVYQCKNVEDLTAAKIRASVGEFLKGKWSDRAHSLVICTTDDLGAAQKADELVVQTQRMHEAGKTLFVWDESALSAMLKLLPSVVDDFFGREWVSEFCGATAAEQLGNRLDATRTSEFRRECGSLYRQVFNQHDPGLPVGAHQLIPSLSIYERFVMPDVMESRTSQALSDQVYAARIGESASPGVRTRTGSGRQKETRAVTEVPARLVAQQWLASGSRFVILGGPGTGKSSLLRYVALDLLSENPRLTDVAVRWGTYLPVWVPFPLWTQMIAAAEDSAPAITDAIRRWLESWGEGRLWPLFEHAMADERLLLLVDGLDEWSNLEAARIAIDRLSVFLGQRSVPALLASRPLGFAQLGLRPEGMQIGTLAPLSQKQQREIALQWFTHASRAEGESNMTPEGARKQEANADAFMGELSASSDLQELAGVPLLLLLLVYLKLHGLVLPSSKQRAYTELLNHLLATHPERRRRAAALIGADASDLTAEELKQALAAVAYTMQTNAPRGVVSDKEVLTVLESYCCETTLGLGMESAPARRMARNLLALGEQFTGLLVRLAPNDLSFLHRSFQEYLAGEWLARLPFDEQRDVFKSRCADVQWQEPLLAALHLTRRADEVERLMEAMRGAAIGVVDQMQVQALLAAATFGDFTLPAKYTRQVAQEVFDAIENGEWRPQRDRLLGAVAQGLRIARTRPLLLERVRRWFPGRLWWRRRKLIEEMAAWPRSDVLRGAMVRATNDEQHDVALAAAHALASLQPVGDGPCDDLWKLASDSMSWQRRDAALQALYQRWPDEVRGSQLLAAAERIAVPALRVSAIAARVDSAQQTPEDKQYLLRLIGRRTWFYHGITGRVVALLSAGWAGDKNLLELCVRSVEDDWVPKEGLNWEAAFDTLLMAFEPTEQIGEAIAEALRRHSYAALGRTETRLLTKYKGNPYMVSYVEELAGGDKHGLDLDYVALLAPSDTVKEALLKEVRESIPVLPTSILLEGWGIGDQRVEQGLRELAYGPAARASLVARHIPDILTNPEECEARLLNLLEDPKSTDVDRVLEGLLRVHGGKLPPGVVDTTLRLLADVASSAQRERAEVAAALIVGAPQDERVRSVARLEGEQREDALYAVAHEYKGDAEFEAMLCDAVSPLPAEMRGALVQALGTGAHTDTASEQFLRLYDVDGDATVKTHASIGYYGSMQQRGAPLDDAKERLARDLVVYGPDYEARRQAALAGLVCLDDLQPFIDARERGDDGKPARVRLNDLGNMNVALAELLAEKWSSIEQQLGDQIDRIELRFGGEQSVWEHLALYGEEAESLRTRLLAELEARDPAPVSEEMLRFVARARPRSALLKAYCLVPLRDRDATNDATRAAAELLGENFGGDENVRRELLAGVPENGIITKKMAIALTEGWPGDEALLRFGQIMKRAGFRGMNYFEYYSVVIALADQKELRLFYDTLFAVNADEEVHLRSLAVRPLLRRLTRDDEASKNAEDFLRSTGLVNARVSLPRLLSSARGLHGELRTWIRERLSESMRPENLTFGEDLIAGAIRALPHSLLDTLNPLSAR